MGTRQILHVNKINNNNRKIKNKNTRGCFA